MNKPMRYTLRALALMLGYPDAKLRDALPALVSAIDGEAVLPADRRAEIRALAGEMLVADPIAVEARYVELFDRGRSTSLHLFEHVHGDSRDRGPAMIDLAQTFEAAGLYLAEGEIPDHLPVVLEYASTQPPREAQAFLAEMAHIFNVIFSALDKRQSRYASLLSALIELAGEKCAPLNVPDEAPIDDSWAEPAAFDGCSSAGQARPGQPQPIQIQRKPQGTAAGARP
jgi:nitrate reductase delta subunit